MDGLDNILIMIAFIFVGTLGGTAYEVETWEDKKEKRQAYILFIIIWVFLIALGIALI